jgi:LCP family protein required for cell wall assembly
MTDVVGGVGQDAGEEPVAGPEGRDEAQESRHSATPAGARDDEGGGEDARNSGEDETEHEAGNVEDGVAAAGDEGDGADDGEDRTVHEAGNAESSGEGDDEGDGADDGEDPTEHEAGNAEDGVAAAGDEGEAGQGEAGLRRARLERRARRRRRLKVGLLAITATTALGVATAFGLAAWDIQHLTHNLKHSALLPSGFTEPTEPVDPFGRSPVNILLIGSDTRDTTADCSLGGACTPGAANDGANGDSEMIVHLSADRSNVTVLSLPRDTETELPDCAGGGRGMINSALSFGPDCQVAAAVKLTGIPIDHFIDFDFSGVVDLSNEVGGVPVCINAAIHDPYTGLTLAAGDSQVQGVEALQFLRTRHAFYDGSDLGREQATHMFLSALLRKVKQSATLTNLSAMQSIAETVTRYTTVDNGLDGVTALLNLGEDFGQVDSDRVTFLTAPWQQDTDEADPSYQYRVEVAPSAAAIFADIKNDKSFTASASDRADGTDSASSSAVPDVPANQATGAAGASAGPSGAGASSGAPAASASAHASEQAAARAHPMHVQVVNASGATERYETVVARVFQDGFVYSSGSNATATQPATTLVYSAAESAAARELAGDLDLPASALQESGTGTTLVLTIGTDWTTGATYPADQAGRSASAAVSVPDQSFEENGGDTTACVTANPDYETGSSGGSGGGSGSGASG